MGMRLMEVWKELSTTENPWSSSRDISLPIALYPWREMEHPEGVHGRERFSFLWAV